ncbi:XRE family transcriptional regulator [Kitasatospora sp. NPDC097643]|uniref:helix-turn-helix domain-containing protein n=1 Tax=Kitasatospora sp. NPDC097643 TaxID=3157230 RepID=UPI0033348C21
MRRRQPPALPPVPFSPAAARAHRAGLGLTPEQVAEGMAAHGVRLLPHHVLAWESGELRPTEEEFIALARALWCPAAQLMGVRPARLRDHRVARELGQEAAARRIGVGLATYQQAELTGKWDGDEDQTHALAQVLGLRLSELVEVTGRREALDQRLRQCVDGRWQAQLRAVARIVPVHQDDLAAVLTVLQQENQVSSHWGAGGWGSPAPAARPEPAREQSLAERFWELLGRAQTDIPV